METARTIATLPRAERPARRPRTGRRSSPTRGARTSTSSRTPPGALLAPARLDGARRFAEAVLRRRGVGARRARTATGAWSTGTATSAPSTSLLGDDGITIVDRLEFDADLRRVDVADDLAFLVMDLHALGARIRRRAKLVAAYRDAGGDPGDPALVAAFATYRAQVRAKVAFLRASQLEDHDAAAARDRALHLLDVSELLAWRARGPLLLVVAGAAGERQVDGRRGAGACRGHRSPGHRRGAQGPAGATSTACTPPTTHTRSRPGAGSTPSSACARREASCEKKDRSWSTRRSATRGSATRSSTRSARGGAHAAAAPRLRGAAWMVRDRARAGAPAALVATRPTPGPDVVRRLSGTAAELPGVPRLEIDTTGGVDDVPSARRRMAGRRCVVSRNRALVSYGWDVRRPLPYRQCA